MADAFPPDSRQDFERQATERAPGILGEFVAFVRHSKKWWLLPILLTLVALGAFLVASGTVAAPWLYTLF